jgi:hypothetical protein
MRPPWRDGLVSASLYLTRDHSPRDNPSGMSTGETFIAGHRDLNVIDHR